jgi:hypothetical protein
MVFPSPSRIAYKVDFLAWDVPIGHIPIVGWALPTAID